MPAVTPGHSPIRNTVLFCVGTVLVVGQAAVAQDKSHRVEVMEQSLCLYGHWITGVAEIVLEDDEIAINGIRVYPNYGPARREGVSDKPVAGLGIVTKDCYEVQASLWKSGASKQEVIDRTLAHLSEREDVASVAKADSFGTLYFIEATNGEECLVSIGHDIPALTATDDDMAKGRRHKAESRYEFLIRSIESAAIYIVTTHGERLIRAEQRGDPEFLGALDAAISATEPIVPENWPHQILSYSIAEEIRNPINLKQYLDGDK